MHKNPLPIDQVLPQIINSLRSKNALVLKADPGAGKTTRVPPAMLDAGLAEIDGKRPGQIVVLQPRRVAARSAAARIAEERGTQLGEEIGYQVRHEGRSSARTRILVCTEGVFLRRLQDDPLLERTAAVVFDEFHERSIDSDLALAMVRQVREQVRPDLRLLVMSATLESEPISRYLNNCPVVESAGRTYPVEIEYLQFEPGAPLPELVADGVRKMLPVTGGHVLAFLPGVGEIRQAQELLSSAGANEDALLMPLYGDMPLEEQQRVLHPTRQRKIVLATNVAETSLTIDGVTAVVDSGMARINRFHAQLGLNRLELERIARAAADQRAGRAGRTGPGRCLRLWTERQHLSMPQFETPEIARVELSQSLLQLIAWGEHDLDKFPWFEAPPGASVERALRLLEMLGVLDGGVLTDMGRRTALLPVQPRLARLILEGESLGYARRAALCAALLSERDPFRRDEIRKPPDYHVDSDVVERLEAIEKFAGTGMRNTAVGQLLPGAVRQIQRTADQLSEMVAEAEHKNFDRDSSAAEDLQKSRQADEAIMRALLCAFPDRVCKRRQPKDKRGVMVGGRGVRLADESGVVDPELFLSVEISDSKQAETLVRQASRVDRAWLPQQLITTNDDVVYDADRKKVVAWRRTKYWDLILEEKQVPVPADADMGAILAAGILAREDVDALVDDSARSYLTRVLCLREWMPELDLPDFAENPWKDLLPEWCMGCASADELSAESLIGCIQSRLTQQQIAALEREAPERISVPSGRAVKLEYAIGKSPILAARIQELFGMEQTPRIAQGGIPVLMHLQAPNYRVQQITPDLASFWKNTYPEVKKELKARYPKHAWPDNPLLPQPQRNAKRSG